MFRGLYLCSISVFFHVEWRIRKNWSSSVMLYNNNNNIIAHNHHTHNVMSFYNYNCNAGHHRSDAFSSLISLASIALAILVPRFAFADAAGGIFGT